MSTNETAPPQHRGLHLVVWVALVTAMVVVVGLALLAQTRRSTLPVLGQWHSFALTNQLGEAVSPDSLKGKVVIADVIFSRCPSQCHQLSLKMSRLQAAVGSGVQLLSLTADPNFDSPAILKQYGQRYGTDPSKWWFLTGSKAEVYRVAEKDLLFTVMDTGEANPKLEDRFIHASNFVVLDKQGRLRAVVQGDDPEVVEKLSSLAKQLVRETNL